MLSFTQTHYADLPFEGDQCHHLYSQVRAYETNDVLFNNGANLFPYFRHFIMVCSCCKTEGTLGRKKQCRLSPEQAFCSWSLVFLIQCYFLNLTDLIISSCYQLQVTNLSHQHCKDDWRFSFLKLSLTYQWNKKNTKPKYTVSPESIFYGEKNDSSVECKL